jgi:hypothetical protein
MFCWMASARCSVLEPVPLRKTDRHTRLPRTLSTTVLGVGGHAHILKILQRRNVGGAIDHQVAFIADPGLEPGQRLGRGAFNLLSGARELAAVAGAGDNAQVLVPCGQAAQVRAYRAERKVALIGAHQVDSRVDVHGDRIHREAFGLAGVDDGRWLIEDVGRKILVGEDHGAGGGNAQRSEAYLREEGSAIELRGSFFVLMCVSSGMCYLFSAPASGGFERNGRSMDSTEIKPVGSAETRL